MLNLPQYTAWDISKESKLLITDASSRLELDLRSKKSDKVSLTIEKSKEAHICFGFSDSDEGSLDLTLDLKEGSHLKVFRYGTPGSHFEHGLQGKIASGASLEIFELFAKPKDGKIKSNVDLSGEGAEYTIHSYTDLDDNTMNHQGLVRHLVPNTFSNQQHRFCLDGASKGNYEGDVFIEEGSSGVRANQLNQNLVLHPDSRMHTKPQLQIFHDDVKCTHGATITQPNPQQLFYLNSRGISPSKAMDLLRQSFKEVIMNSCHAPEVLQKVQASFGV